MFILNINSLEISHSNPASSESIQTSYLWMFIYLLKIIWSTSLLLKVTEWLILMFISINLPYLRNVGCAIIIFFFFLYKTLDTNSWTKAWPFDNTTNDTLTGFYHNVLSISLKSILVSSLLWFKHLYHSLGFFFTVCSSWISFNSLSIVGGLLHIKLTNWNAWTLHPAFFFFLQQSCQAHLHKSSLTTRHMTHNQLACFYWEDLHVCPSLITIFLLVRTMWHKLVFYFILCNQGWMRKTERDERER